MAKPRMDVTAFVGKLLEEDDADLLREGVRVLAQMAMETEFSAQIGAAPYQRSGSRTAYRNGYLPGPGTLGWAPSSSRSPR
jgi:transposase-like protein